MKYLNIARAVLFLPLAVFPYSSNSADLTFQGISGVLVTPDARLLKKGQFSYQYNNYLEPHLDKQYKDSSVNHVFSIGISDYLELGGRLTDYNRVGASYNPNGTKRAKIDLSGNLKIKIPKFTDWMPDVAIGINDFAGEAVNFRSKYIVITQSLKDLNIDADISVGYATGDNPSFDGKFVNLKYKLLPELSILAEHDANNSRIGASYDFSKYTRLPLSIKVGSPVNGDGSAIVGLSLQFPLDRKRSKYIKTKSAKEIVRKLDGAESVRITRLMNKLAGYGLEDLKAGRNKAGQYVIFAENRIYNHSAMDAISIILGTAHEYLNNSDSLQVVLTRQGSPEIVVNTGILALAKYLSDGSSSSRNQFNKQLSVSIPNPRMSVKNITWFNGYSSGSSPRVEIQLRPKLVTNVGHEWGALDYSLGVAASAKVNIWKGGNLLVSGVAPVHSTKNFDENGVFRRQRIKSNLSEVLLQQHYKANKNLSILGSVGKVRINRNDYSTVQAQARWISNSGSHQFSTNLARYKAKKNLIGNKTLAIASYERFLGNFDKSYELSYGKYFEGDKGLKVEFKRRFGDTQISTFVNYINKQDISGGLGFTFPVTPRKDYKNKYVLLRGDSAWHYQQSTTIKDPVVVGSNRLRPNMMLEPKLGNSLSKNYLDSNRLTPGYIKGHVERLREAYLTLSK